MNKDLAIKPKITSPCPLLVKEGVAQSAGSGLYFTKQLLNQSIILQGVRGGCSPYLFYFLIPNKLLIIYTQLPTSTSPCPLLVKKGVAQSAGGEPYKYQKIKWYFCI
jgi:hypothetical protein